MHDMTYHWKALDLRSSNLLSDSLSADKKVPKNAILFRDIGVICSDLSLKSFLSQEFKFVIGCLISG